MLLAVFCTGPGCDRLGNLSLPEERQTQTLAAVSLRLANGLYRMVVELRQRCHEIWDVLQRHGVLKEATRAMRSL